jgi:flotillin
MSISAILIPIGIVALIIGAIVAFLCSIYRVADIDKALIITGGKEPIVKVSGGSFVIPIFRKAQYFDLCMLTVKADKDEIKTITSVPIVTDWTAQIRPDTNDPEKLKKAIISFKERGSEGIIQDVKLTLTGAVRDIVASMTPEAVLRDKAEFAQKVRTTVEDEMANMGMELVSLNIQDITDNNGYYDNIAALDMGDKRLAAENKRATVDQEVRRQ